MERPTQKTGMTMKYLLCIFLVILAVVAAYRKRYDGYEEWEVIVGDRKQVEVLRRLEEDGQVDILKTPLPGKRGVVLVAPEVKRRLMSTLLVSGIRARVIDTDIQKKIDIQYASIDARYKEDPYAFDINKYNKFDSLMNQMSVWVLNCPSGLECSKYSIGKSYEGRDMTILKIKKAGSSNKALYFEFTIHAREWLSTTTGQNLIHKIINEYSTDSDAKDLADTYDIYVLLVANPDGYVYSFNNDRMWRKSRSPNNGSTCVGTDLNRNYEGLWGKQGAEMDPCSNGYAGESPASEIETQNMQAEIARIKGTVIAMYGVHCCLKVWGFQYGYTEDFTDLTECVHTNVHADLNQVAKAATDAMYEEFGEHWKYGTICETIYPVTGGSVGYAFAKQGIKYSWALEVSGQLVDHETSIAPSFKQFWTGLIASAKEIFKIEGY